MKRLVYVFSTALALLLIASSETLAQSVPPINRLTSLQRQQLAQDLVPSGAKDFFNAGQVKLEQEIRLLTKPRSPLNEKLLTVSQDVQMQPTVPREQPDFLQRD